MRRKDIDALEFYTAAYPPTWTSDDPLRVSAYAIKYSQDAQPVKPKPPLPPPIWASYDKNTDGAVTGST